VNRWHRRISTTTVAIGALAACTIGLPTSALEPAAATPAGFQRIADDTGQLSLDVPVAWSDVVTSPVDLDGTPVPTVAATTPGSGFPSSPSASGVLFFAAQFTESVGRLANAFAPEGCAAVAVEPFQNGVLTGETRRFGACGSSGEYVVTAANPPTGAYTAVLVVMVAAPVDPTIVPTVLASLNRPASTAPPTTQATTVPVAPTVPIAPSTSIVTPAPPTLAPPTAPPTVAAPTTAPATTAPATAASTAPTTPPTADVATGTAGHGVVVTDGGDATNAVNLVVPLSVGLRGRSENYSSTNGTITVSGSESFTTDWEEAEYHVGVDEVLAVNPDGSFQLRYTPSQIDTSLTYSNPDISGTGPDVALLEGVPLTITYGADRQSTSVVAAPATTVSPEQQAVIDTLEYRMPGHGFPSRPVGPGATWTAPTTFVVDGVRGTASTTYQVVSVDGGVFEVTGQTTFDLSQADPATYPSNVTSASGLITVTTSVTGSVANAMQYREVSTVRTATTVTFTDGRTIRADSTASESYEQFPL
jgi:hypothetical protein